MEASLVLKNGCTYSGQAPEWQTEPAFGEVVFTTGMTGYPESLTDPSYTGQILVFTYPLIGNYGVPSPKEWESEKIHAAGVVISEVCQDHSLLEWLKTQKISALLGVDTRALTKELRSAGTMLGAITLEPKKVYTFQEMTHPVSRAACKEIRTYNSEKKVVIAIDCGMKENIIRNLSKLPITVKRVPFDYDFTEEHYDGVFISNGPGDPTDCTTTIEILKKVFQKEKPVFGICLGTQLMALASGAKTYKLPFGHRGHNQPCIELASRKCFITSQNHGYAIDEMSLSSEWEVSFKNLNDGSVEGIRHKTKPFFSVQFHPEAAPGPTDTTWLFNQFYQLL